MGAVQQVLLSQKIAGGGGSSLLTDLSVYWNMDEASGNRASSVGSNTLVDNNTVTSAAGVVSNAASFAAANSEYLNLADNADISLGDFDFTFAWWVRPDTLTSNQSMIGKDGFDIVFDANGAVYAFVGGNFIGGTASNALAVNTWAFVLVEFTASSDVISISINNSVAYTSGAITPQTDGGGDFYVGRWSASATNFLNARIDELGLWKRLLTGGEKTSLYNSGNGTTYPF